MNLSQRCQYALRALFELATRGGEGPIPAGEIAEAQAIPPRFLELILAELKQAGYVESQRGARGGYQLAVSPDGVTVGEVIRLVEGPLGPVKCLASPDHGDCPLMGRCVFLGLWERAYEAVSQVYDTTSLQDLVDQAGAAQQRYVASYCI